MGRAGSKASWGKALGSGKVGLASLQVGLAKMHKSGPSKEQGLGEWASGPCKLHKSGRARSKASWGKALGSGKVGLARLSSGPFEIQVGLQVGLAKMHKSG